MRHLVLLFGLLAATATLADNSTAFVEGGARYQAGDFKGAAALYESLVDAGLGTADVHYNLGNVYFRLGLEGKALAAYERALRVRPRDADALWNRELLKSVLADRIESRPPGWLVWLEAVSIDELARVFSAALCLCALLAVGGYFKPGARAWRPLRTVALLLLLAAAALFAGKWSQVKDPRAVVIEKEVTARYGPSVRESRAFVLHEGALARVTDQTDEWYRLMLPGRQSGWVPKNSTELV
ncbi:MAG: hypothetical protein A3D28_02515 [Omnitrophica bacterium RIFCSPHIGHO2_02_FULL_63_14]|nr:MAG: hypothetical protein A3D28_02515 [Omnitrophica bacterium RIFCSPHIGHO2_02_FULL_63_14]